MDRLVYGLVANYYPTSARAAGVAWCAGFGRLGGILGPVIGGALVGAGLGGGTAFRIFALVAVLGAAVTVLVPRSRIEDPVELRVTSGATPTGHLHERGLPLVRGGSRCRLGTRPSRSFSPTLAGRGELVALRRLRPTGS